MQESLGDIQPQTRSAIGQAKLAVTAGDLEQAIEILTAALEALGTRATLPLQSLGTMRKHLLEAEAHFTAQDRRISALQQDVKALQRDNRQTRLDRGNQQLSRQKKEEHVLLGEAAYKFSALVEEYVYQGRDPTALQQLSLKQMAKKREKGKLTTEQEKRWDRVLQQAPNGLPVDILVQSDAVLRAQRFESAHGTREQLRGTKIQELRQWADAYIDSRALQPVHQYLDFLNNFTSKNMPLYPDKKIT